MLHEIFCAELFCHDVISLECGVKHVNVSNANKAIEWTATNNTWRHAQNVVSLRVLYKFNNLISTLVICLKFAFIEMLDKLITYIVCLYKTLYQVLPVVWTNCITTRIATRSDLDLIQFLVPPHYVCNGYILGAAYDTIKGYIWSSMIQ
jgi:hypothetical protein